MNGRIYDPTLGRFLQADPHIQAPMNSQNYNRYSYVLNNPMSYTDPSGYFFKSLFKGIKKYWRVIAAAVVTYVTAGAASGWAASWGLSGWAAGAATGAIAGAAGGFVATGSLKGALKGAFTGAAFGAIGASFNGEAGSGFFAEGGIGHIGSHALTGGIMADLQGGKFGHGFWSAGLTKAANVNGIVGTDQGVGWDTARIAVAATIGGTISKLTGGKFGNGAVTAGFAQMLNGNQQARKKAQEQRARLQERYNNERRWSVQIGIKGGLKAIKGLEGDAGLYVGVNENGEIDWGTYQTATGALSSEYGSEVGLQVAYGDVYTNDLAGQSVGMSGGLDTPALDVDVGLEAVAGGTIYNFAITVGPEVSTLGVGAYGQEINQTWTQRLNR